MLLPSASSVNYFLDADKVEGILDWRWDGNYIKGSGIDLKLIIEIWSDSEKW